MNPSLPPWLSQPDRDFSTFTAEEARDLLALRERWGQQGHDDRWHAAVGELRPDGATVARPLTLPRLEAWAEDTWNGTRSPDFSMAPPA